MDIELKKSILLTIKMANAHQNKFQFTSTRIINIELFYQVCFILLPS